MPVKSQTKPLVPLACNLASSTTIYVVEVKLLLDNDVHMSEMEERKEKRDLSVEYVMHTGNIYGLSRKNTSGTERERER